MYLKKIRLKNIKCFSDITLDFSPEGQPRLWTVILGQNGLGKSTLLQAIGIVLAGPIAIRELLPVAEGWVKRDCPYGEIEAELLWTDGDAQIPKWPKKTPYTVKYAIVGEDVDNESLPSNLASQYTGVPIVTEWAGDGVSKKQENISKDLNRLKQTAYAEGKAGWFGCGYGPFRRLSGGAQNADRILYSGRKSARFITLFREDAALTNATEWLISLYNTGRDGNELSQRTLKQVKRTFEAEFLPRPAELLVNAQSALLRIEGHEPVPFRDLSDGYRSMLAMGIDLLRWISAAFPEEEDLMGVTGVVVIDELDAHAHPAWQREIGHWLRRKFPKLQFIIATHSPFLAQVADEPGGNIVLVQTEAGVQKRDDVELVEAWRADQILTDLMELDSTRSPEVDRKIHRLNELSQKREALEQKQERLPLPQEAEYQQLRLWVEQLPPAIEDPLQRRQAERVQQEIAQALPQLEELE